MKSVKIAFMAGMSALIVGAGVSVMPAPAAAQGVEFNIGPGGVRVVRPDEERRYQRRDDRGYGGGYGGGCSPRQALSAASRYLYDPQINSTRRGYYAIDGYGKKGGNRGGPDSVRISSAPGCDRV